MERLVAKQQKKEKSAMANRPLGREKNVSGGGSGVHRTDHAGGGPVGGGHGPGGSGGGRRDFDSGSSGGYGGGGNSLTRSVGGRGILAVIIAIVVIFSIFRGGSGGLSSLFSSGETQQTTNLSSNTISGWDAGSNNTGQLDTTVVSGAREKRTQILGNGQDEVTVLIYLCGTDLESRSAMATRDLMEMTKAKYGDNVHVIAYTGGCSRWQNKIISAKTNQIYQVMDGGLKLLNKDMGNGAMTDPKTLTQFLNWGKKNFPANRYELILWDHGSGSNTGYGYDEKYPRAGAMDLAEISSALKASGMTFDFIGFDACLMATVETGLMLSQYADYMIASEETEPGIGWYYTDWLNALGSDTSISTPELGKIIIDSYTKACASTCRGQSTTLSLTDLAELSYTVPDRITSFAQNINNLVENKDYAKVSAARSGSREFAASSRIDQVDLVHFCKKLNTNTGFELANALQGAVKYNVTSRDMTNAYGLSVYFPYKNRSVDSMVNTYKKIGMDADYIRCIQNCATYNTYGSVAAGGTSSPMGSIFDMLGGGSSGSLGNGYDSGSGGLSDLLGGTMIGSGSSGMGSMSSGDISDLLGMFLSGRSKAQVEGVDSSNMEYLKAGPDVEEVAEYLAENHFDESALTWQQATDGSYFLPIEESQWDLVQSLDLSMYYDDGEGYVELGCDNVFEFNKDGQVVAPTDRTWVSIDDQIVAYYRIGMSGTEEDYTITGRVPAELNGDRVNLILVFDTEHPNGYVAGAAYDYEKEETETIPKNLTTLNVGDRINFLCDFYSYDGKYQDSYHLGKTMTVTKEMEDMVISNQSVGDGGVLVSYKFTDLYSQDYWTPGLVIG